MDRLKNWKISLLQNGTMGGIPTVLLNQGSQLGIDVIRLVVKNIERIPDFRDPAELSRTICRLVLGYHVMYHCCYRKQKKLKKG